MEFPACVKANISKHGRSWVKDSLTKHVHMTIWAVGFAPFGREMPLTKQSYYSFCPRRIAEAAISFAWQRWSTKSAKYFHLPCFW